MDPLTIATTCGGLALGVAGALKQTIAFANDVRDARQDVDTVSAELGAIQRCLEHIETDWKKYPITLPEPLCHHLGQILLNIEYNIIQIQDILRKLQIGKLGRRIMWGLTQKDEVNKLRSSLESNKATLQIALSLGNISELARQTAMSRRVPDVAMGLTAIATKVDTLINMHVADSRLDIIKGEIFNLQQLLLHRSGSGRKRSAVSTNFARQAKLYAKTILEPARAKDARISSLMWSIDESGEQEVTMKTDPDSTSNHTLDDHTIYFDPSDTSFAASRESLETLSDNFQDHFLLIDLPDTQQTARFDDRPMRNFLDAEQHIRRQSAPARKSQPKIQIQTVELAQETSAPTSPVPTIGSQYTMSYRKPIPMIEFKVVVNSDKFRLRLKSFVLDVLQYDHAPTKTMNMSQDKVKSLMTDMLRIQAYGGIEAWFRAVDSPESILLKYNRVIGEVLRILGWKKALKALSYYRLLLQIQDTPLLNIAESAASWGNVVNGDSVWLMIWNSEPTRSRSFDETIQSGRSYHVENTSFPNPAQQNLTLISFEDETVLNRFNVTPVYRHKLPTNKR